ncbi:hypothetical protein [Ferruginibacter sp.]|nr:hypothetical protein [Ferruginibacter sp.]
MKEKKQGLQKLTETEKKIAILLSKKKVTQAEIDKVLNYDEKQVLGQVLTNKINESKGNERDFLLDQIAEIIPADTKNQLWENNHYIIMHSMTKFIDEYGKMPTKNNIAKDTGLSRQTVYKHLNCFAEHPLYVEQLQQFKFMTDRILSKVIKAASLGDMKAARLYFDVIGNLNTQSANKTLIQTQHNYIQINGTVLSQDVIKQLTAEQVGIIEATIKNVLTNIEDKTVT